MQRLHSASSRPLERSWSLNDGYSCNTGDERASEKSPDEEETVDAMADDFTVDWDENDPSCPRNFSKPRRWLIVIICSLGSLCV